MQEAIKELQTVNGVDVTGLFGTLDAVRRQPEISRFNFRAVNRWVGGGSSNQTTVNEYSGACREIGRAAPFVFQKDEPPVFADADQDANPVEYALAALAGCLTTSLVYHAAAQGIELQEVESIYEGDLDLHGTLGLDERARSGCENLRVSFRVRGSAPPDKLRELVELARRRSPVFDVVTDGAAVSVRAV